MEEKRKESIHMQEISEMLRLNIGNEEILWHGKPNKKCFILESIFNSFLPFALLWGGIDFGILGSVVMVATSKEEIIPMLFFLVLHMMPVWIYIGGIMCSVLRYKHTEYAVTNKSIYVQKGLFTINIEMKPFTDLSHVTLHRGIIDQMLGVGDVRCICSHSNDYYMDHSHDDHGVDISDIEDYVKVFELVKQLQEDIYSDTMFPNDMRPETNHGYKTKYEGKGKHVVFFSDDAFRSK